jgi:hypothetical protein
MLNRHHVCEEGCLEMTVLETSTGSWCLTLGPNQIGKNKVIEKIEDRHSNFYRLGRVESSNRDRDRKKTKREYSQGKKVF